jgi:hypothetical protein
MWGPRNAYGRWRQVPQSLHRALGGREWTTQPVRRQQRYRNRRNRDEKRGKGRAGAIEIAFPTGARVSVDAVVNEEVLSRVLRAMRGLT